MGKRWKKVWLSRVKGKQVKEVGKPHILDAEYKKTMRKEKLMEIAEGFGVEVEEEMTKREIVDKLDKLKEKFYE